MSLRFDKHDYEFPSPESGIINSFISRSLFRKLNESFRPLSRGLSIPSWTLLVYIIRQISFRPLSRGLSIPSCKVIHTDPRLAVSVPWVGDYQFLLTSLSWYDTPCQFPSPESGIINSFFILYFPNLSSSVSVPWVGDYQFLPWRRGQYRTGLRSFRPLSRGFSIPSPFFFFILFMSISFRPLSRGLSIPSSQWIQDRLLNRVSVPWVGDYQFLRSGGLSAPQGSCRFRPLSRGLSIPSEI